MRHALLGLILTIFLFGSPVRAEIESTCVKSEIKSQLNELLPARTVIENGKQLWRSLNLKPSDHSFYYQDSENLLEWLGGNLRTIKSDPKTQPDRILKAGSLMARIAKLPSHGGADTYAEFHNVIYETTLFYQTPTSPSGTSRYRSVPHTMLTGLVQQAPSFLVIPTHLNLDIPSFNRAANYPIAFEGIQRNDVYADSLLMSPEVFAVHDIDHGVRLERSLEIYVFGNQIVGRARSLEENKQLYKKVAELTQYSDAFLDRVDQISDPTLRETVHMMTFYLWHEDLSILDPANLKTFAETSKRDFFGRPKIPPKIVRLIERLKKPHDLYLSSGTLRIEEARRWMLDHI